MLSGQIYRSSLSARGRLTRSLHQSLVAMAKNDKSTIDSYRLPSQTSINEWEFKYDFVPKTSEPKIPPLTPEAVKQDIAEQKRAKVEKEMLDQELATSVKVEANDLHVVHGGEIVGAEPEYLHDKGSDPVDASHVNASSKATPSRSDKHKYMQTLINPDINSPDVINLSQGEVSHKVQSTEGQAQVLDDVEHAEHELHKQNAAASSNSTSGASKWLLPLGFFGVGYFAYEYFQSPKAASKPAVAK